MQERLRKVRELENTRAAMVAKLPNTVSPGKTNKKEQVTNPSQQEDTCEEIAHNTLTPETKSKKISPNKLSRIKESNPIVKLIYMLRLIYIFLFSF